MGKCSFMDPAIAVNDRTALTAKDECFGEPLHFQGLVKMAQSWGKQFAR